jgi:hypothetical protein
VAFLTVLDAPCRRTAPIRQRRTRRDGRYSPAKCLGIEKHRVLGNPAEEHVSTSFVERSNLTLMHRTLKMTPALAAGVSETLWSKEDVVALVDAFDAAQPRQKPGRKPKAAKQ